MGIFFSQDGKPFFSPDEHRRFEITTNMSFGPKIEVNPNPEELEPNKYYQFGTVQTEIKIIRLKSLSSDYVESYKGEFEIGLGGSVKFPSTVRWNCCPEFNHVGSIYKFSIENGLGTFIEFKI